MRVVRVRFRVEHHISSVDPERPLIGGFCEGFEVQQGSQALTATVQDCAGEGKDSLRELFAR